MVRWSFNNPVSFKVACRLCEDESVITCDLDDVEEFKSGVPMQQCMGYLHADQRELLISGTCGACFDKLFQE